MFGQTVATRYRSACSALVQQISSAVKIQGRGRQLDRLYPPNAQAGKPVPRADKKRDSLGMLECSGLFSR